MPCFGLLIENNFRLSGVLIILNFALSS
jgi:hypothetical protein